MHPKLKIRENYNINSIQNMKTLVLRLASLLAIFMMCGIQSPVQAQEIRESKASGKVYDATDIRPFFPGGDAALLPWIKANIKYPAKAKEKGVTGRVVVTFIVEIDGSLSDIKIIRNTAPEFKAEFEAEAIRLVKAMPAWDPAKIIIDRTTDRTEDVRYRYTCPIVFI
jgi:TonB family protein